MDASGFLARIQSGRHYRGQIAAARYLPARSAAYAAPGRPLDARIGGLLAALEIGQLYSHQAECCDAVLGGEDVVVATGTASGKSLCYQLPALSMLLRDADARALFLYPAKALAYDQLGNLERMVALGGFEEVARPACYDGDTPTHKRPGIRRHATILLSNPDMLHQSFLPYHTKWAGFFARLRLVVLDEIHTYRGIFGSHVAGVVRRLRRVCRHYGATPQFVCCSATLANPRELAERLTGCPMRLIDRDGSPRGGRWFVLWNPPWTGGDEEAPTHEGTEVRTEGTKARRHEGAVATEHECPEAAAATALAKTSRAAAAGTGLRPATPRIARRSGNVEAQYLMQDLLEEGAGTIAFTKARVVAELLYKYLIDSLGRRRPDLARKVRPYRGGYLPLERREIERKLFNGELLGVCSTNALELGIDVGSLDAAIIVGFPGTLCSLWQQAGRAGRRRDESVIFFVAYDDPIDQYLMRNADFVFERPLEQAIIDPRNPHILAAQLGCAAYELPLAKSDLAEFGAAAAEVAAALAEEGRLRHTGQKYFWASSEFAAAKTSLRTISNATFAIVDITGGRNEVLGQVDSISAPELVYPEAVYLHQAESYIVRQLDWQARLARVERFDADYYTQPVLASDVRIVQERERGEVAARHEGTEACAYEAGQEGDQGPGIGNQPARAALVAVSPARVAGAKFFGDVIVQWQTIAFRKFKFQTAELIGQTALDLPAQRINTTALWLQPPADVLQTTAGAGHKVWEALAGVRNLLVVTLPTLAMCDRYDIGGVVDTTQLGTATIIIYDRFEGGVGYARHGFDCCGRLLRMAYEIVRGCDCEDGCPGCVAPPNVRVPIHHDPDVYRGYEMPSKRATSALLSAWIARIA